ncbi:MAG: S41 family peptidase [Bdellovibrionales bacterium]
MRRLLPFFVALSPCLSQAQDPWAKVVLPASIERVVTAGAMQCGPNQELHGLLFCLEMFDVGLQAVASADGRPFYLIPRRVLEGGEFELLVDTEGVPVAADGPFVIAQPTVEFHKRLLDLSITDPPGYRLALEVFDSRFRLTLQNMSVEERQLVRVDTLRERFFDFRRDSITRTKMVAAMYSGILQKRDPYARFEPMETSSEAGFHLGGELHHAQGVSIVSRVDPLSPGDQLGIVVGDRVLSLNGQPFTVDRWIEFLLQRDASEDQILNITLELQDRSGRVKSLNSKLAKSADRNVVPYRFIADGKRIGGIMISSFDADDVCSKTGKAIQELVRAGVDAFVLDFRDNGGGYLDEAACVVSLFVGPGKRTFKRKLLREGIDYENFLPDLAQIEAGVVTKKKKLAPAIPVVSIINSGSASAGELAPLYLRELVGGWIVGQRSFGKGIVQTSRKLTGSEGVRLYTTSSRIELDDGSSPHVYGVDPNFEENSSVAEIDGEKFARRITEVHGKAFQTTNPPPRISPSRLPQENRIRECLQRGKAEALKGDGPAANWLLDQQLRLATAVALCELELTKRITPSGGRKGRRPVRQWPGAPRKLNP